jgi:hypothetical protein
MCVEMEMEMEMEYKRYALALLRAGDTLAVAIL